jgi:hypothetical protein
MALLGGRLRATVPPGAALAPRRRNVMAAEEASTEESRVILVPGDGERARFVMLAREGFELGSRDPVKDAQVLVREDREERYRIEPLQVGSGLKAASFVPEGRAHGKGPLLVLGALLEQPDNTIQTVLFFILPEMASERASWEVKARAIAMTLSAAGKALEHPAGLKRLDSGAGSDLVLELPRGYVVNQQQGPDFVVYHVRKLTRVGAPPALLGLYIGGHPSYQYKQNERGEEGLTRSKGALLGQPVEWLSWDLPEGGLRMIEGMSKLGERDFVHAFATGDPSTLPELRALAEGAKVVPRPH